jgi:hypothetical protein
VCICALYRLAAPYFGFALPRGKASEAAASPFATHLEQDDSEDNDLDAPASPASSTPLATVLTATEGAAHTSPSLASASESNVGGHTSSTHAGNSSYAAGSTTAVGAHRHGHVHPDDTAALDETAHDSHSDDGRHSATAAACETTAATGRDGASDVANNHSNQASRKDRVPRNEESGLLAKLSRFGPGALVEKLMAGRSRKKDGGNGAGSISPTSKARSLSDGKAELAVANAPKVKKPSGLRLAVRSVREVRFDAE